VHQAVGSLGSSWGQRDSRSAIHASRQLSGKVLRYLKRVIVTPAVYRRLAPLKQSFTYRHWADVTSCTHPFGLAACCVFIKQSEPPCHCDASLNEMRTPYTEGMRLICRIPSTGVSQHTLGFSPRGTCVGSQYGRKSINLFPFH